MKEILKIHEESDYSEGNTTDSRKKTCVNERHEKESKHIRVWLIFLKCCHEKLSSCNLNFGLIRMKIFSPTNVSTPLGNIFVIFG